MDCSSPQVHDRACRFLGKMTRLVKGKSSPSSHRRVPSVSVRANPAFEAAVLAPVKCSSDSMVTDAVARVTVIVTAGTEVLPAVSGVSSYTAHG